MQDEITQKMLSEASRVGLNVTTKAIALSFRANKLTARVLYKAIKNYQNKTPTGKQTVKELAKQNQGMSSLDINNTDIKIFEKSMKKYFVDYAIMTNTTTSPPTHTMFFKGKDADAITKAFQDFTDNLANPQKKRPSVIAQLNKLAKQIKDTPRIPKEKVLEKVGQVTR
ncbi:MAG: PcfB family protein [Clostridia bacterium]